MNGRFLAGLYSARQAVCLFSNGAGYFGTLSGDEKIIELGKVESTTYTAGGHTTTDYSVNGSGHYDKHYVVKGIYSHTELAMLRATFDADTPGGHLKSISSACLLYRTCN